MIRKAKRRMEDRNPAAADPERSTFRNTQTDKRFVEPRSWFVRGHGFLVWRAMCCAYSLSIARMEHPLKG